MQTVCTIDDWAAAFARIEKSTTLRNGAAIEIPLGLGYAEITSHEPPKGWYRITLVYPPGVVRRNRDGVPFKDFDPCFNSPLEIWRVICGRIYGYKTALEAAKAAGVLR
jgi:hypothetical protein